MSITITITDPHLLSLDERRRLVEYLNPSERETVVRIVPNVPHPHVSGLSVVVPPAPPAPSLPLTTIPPVSGTNLDSRGYPWDARIHAESKSKNNDGTWRYRRGVKDDVIQPVEAELRGVMGMTVPVVPQEGEPVATVPPAPTASDVPPPPPAAPAPTEPAPTGSASDDFNHLVNVATKALAAKTITQAQITAILNEVGEANGCVLPHLGALFTRKDLIPAVREKLQALIGGGV